MKFSAIAITIASIASVDAFAPAFGVKSELVCLSAKHVQNKAARKAAHNRPKKSRPSDINRTRKVYAFESMPKPPEITEVEGSGN
mmetsp:Transcript_23106/g.35653  ORF Transcript_23106/g.35653 Transcript_23106/m.35653 type:complete len:85 (-) Transcript_23106:170-424(-)|eukprot:CAMPEP_0196811886 /NCGR_PEP_ID=MMETSP1362-20130617/20115_1 /TAXON_ID=163516 /ORGANISM="Leptocylindrus danicus, Strain CCMP1856" /LENGTH=84 /DNA_ID=CAMNT_0042187283 /DNA_START=52 /DNA_END=306 /DNA_ORIENTATION=+